MDYSSASSIPPYPLTRPAPSGSGGRGRGREGGDGWKTCFGNSRPSACTYAHATAHSNYAAARSNEIAAL